MSAVAGSGPRSMADVIRDHARRRPDRVCILFGDSQTTYEELDRRSNRVANALAAAGVGRGARVAILAKNVDTFFELYYGACKASAVVVPVNFRLAPPEVAYVVVAAPGAALDEHELEAFARANLAGYKIPRSYDFVDELPRNPSGKTLKRNLRAPYWAERGRQVN